MLLFVLCTFFSVVNILWNGFCFACQGSQQHWTWKKKLVIWRTLLQLVLKSFFEKCIWVVVGCYTTFSDMLTRFFLTFFQMARSQVQGQTKESASQVSMTRTSKTGWVQDSFHPAIAKMSERVRHITKLFTNTMYDEAELLQVCIVFPTHVISFVT